MTASSRSPSYRRFDSAAGRHILIVPHSRIYDLPAAWLGPDDSLVPEAVGAVEALALPVEGEASLDAVSLPSPRSISLNVSSSCNLACSYCYAGRGKFEGRQAGSMPWAVAQAGLDRLLHDATEDERFTIGFIGGEPARAARATGINWAFAPTLAVVQDQRWVRTYESFSTDPALVRQYASSYVRGLQGDLSGPLDALATAKHFLDDGGTFNGVDQGDTRVSLDELVRVHAQGYYGALDAGVQTVMVSYSSWNEAGVGERGTRMHANRYLITDVLKGRLGFDGFVVSDWNAVEQIPGCTRTRCAEAINAGIDMVMVPDEWRGFIRDTLEDVRSGAIPMSRIDDAVSRNLRVKLRSGLFDADPGRVAFPVVGKNGANWRIQGKPEKIIVSGPIFEHHYKKIREKFGDFDLAAVCIIEPEELVDESFGVQFENQQKKFPIFNHLDRLAR